MWLSLTGIALLGAYRWANVHIWKAVPFLLRLSWAKLPSATRGYLDVFGITWPGLFLLPICLFMYIHGICCTIIRFPSNKFGGAHLYKQGGEGHCPRVSSSLASAGFLEEMVFMCYLVSDPYSYECISFLYSPLFVQCMCQKHKVLHQDNFIVSRCYKEFSLDFIFISTINLCVPKSMISNMYR